MKAWLLDSYSEGDGLGLWFAGKEGERFKVHVPFPIIVYAAGESKRLRALWRYFRHACPEIELARVERRDIFESALVPALCATLRNHEKAQSLLFKATSDFPDLNWYNLDIPLPVRYAAATRAFPLCLCEVNGTHVTALETPWELDTKDVPLKILELFPDCDPSHAEPRVLHVKHAKGTTKLSFASPRTLLISLNALLYQTDPDILLTTYGDTWLLKWLAQKAAELGLPLALNRDENKTFNVISERSYFSYGQIVYRGAQIHLYGRLHIDKRNAMLYDDYGLEGAFEFARVTSLPIQTAARVSPGTGISTMQMIIALRNGILIPSHKQQAESPKSGLDLLQRDQGGMIYQPLIGVHEHVAEVDFVSMYPSLMVRFNISPETARDPKPELLLPFESEVPGLIPQTLEPLLEKRLALKRRLMEMPQWHPNRRKDSVRSSAHKWLLVTCFGYLGYKNARFGKIEAHEAVTAYGREALLRAKEQIEDMGGEILHMYVDGLWIQRNGWTQVSDYQPMLEAINQATGLSIALDGIFRWVAFLPSKLDSRIPVPNRYFGVFQDGTIKVRGLEARRHDTPRWIAQTQMKLLECLAQAEDKESLKDYFPECAQIVRDALRRLMKDEVPLDDLLITQRLGREVSAYKGNSPSARVVQQLLSAGKHIQPGQRVRYLLTLGSPGVQAWDVPCDAVYVDKRKYKVLLMRAAEAVLSPLGAGDVEGLVSGCEQTMLIYL